MEFVSCYIEGKNYPRETCHRHHKTPRHAGGSDSPDNLVWLSANSHQMVHRASQMVRTGRKGMAIDLANAAYASPAQRQRFMEIVHEEVTSALAPDVDRAVVVEVPIPKEAYVRLKLLVSDRSAGSKKISITDYVSRIVQNHVRKFSE